MTDTLQDACDAWHAFPEEDCRERILEARSQGDEMDIVILRLAEMALSTNLAQQTEADCPDCERESPLLCEAHTTVTPMLRHGKSADWWAGVRAFADAVGSTIDEDGFDTEQASSNIAGLLDADARRDSPDTWKKFAYKEPKL